MTQIKFAMVAGEPSGDRLGASLIKELKKNYPHAKFYGIGGPLMCAEGFETFHNMERLSIMGFHIFFRYFELKPVNIRLINYFVKTKPDVFIGIDAYSFNHKIHQKLKPHDIKTVQYVAPKIWAWRPGRGNKIKKYVDLVLALFPFECAAYQKRNIPIKFIGHPMADEIPLLPNNPSGNLENKKIITVLPGSRGVDIDLHSKLFIETIKIIHQKCTNSIFLIPLPTKQLKIRFAKYLQKYGSNLPVQILSENTRQIISKADVVLVKSGTATFETLLLKKPMVVAYQMGFLTYNILRFLVKVPFIALPNLLANAQIVEEFIQKEASPEVLASAVLKCLNSPDKNAKLMEQYQKIHQDLKQQSSHQAAQAILNLVHEQ